MRSLALAALMLLAVAAPAHAAVPFEDKITHLGVSYLITDQLIRTGLPPEYAVIGVMTLGVGKELVDPVFDVGDLAADALGVAAAAYLRVELKF